MPKRFPRHIWNTMDEESRQKIVKLNADTPGLFTYNIHPEFRNTPDFYTPVPPGAGRPSPVVSSHLSSKRDMVPKAVPPLCLGPKAVPRQMKPRRLELKVVPRRPVLKRRSPETPSQGALPQRAT